MTQETDLASLYRELMDDPAQKKLAAESCRCVFCAECNGSGFIWVDLQGHYLGRNRSDDMDETERCEECGGSGIAEECDRCQALRDLDN